VYRLKLFGAKALLVTILLPRGLLKSLSLGGLSAVNVVSALRDEPAHDRLSVKFLKPIGIMDR
jgi:hypothetical protein